ncbi:S8 family peptidase [Actinocrinis puniceicyclus]|nr:S8 family serine peptidase [Actinocrinis puniceicyclus]
MLTATGTIALTALTVTPAHATTNPVYDKEWALSQFQVTKIRSQYQARGSGVIVAVVDSGVDPTQPDLQGSLLSGLNFSVPSNPSSDTNDRSSDYHGTDVAAMVAAHAHGDPKNPQGLYGLATEAKILPLVDGAEKATATSSAAAIRYAVDHNARVINISGGTLGPCTRDLASSLDYALSKNVVVVAAAGNDGNTTNTASCPADHPGVIDVSAIDQSGHMDKYSHYGNDVTVAAPGVDIEEPARGGNYDTASGSSLAAPWVSAEAALIIGKHPDWTAGQVIRVIIGNTVQGTGQRIDDHVGYGVIDPLKALGAAAPTDTSNPLGGPASSAVTTTTTAPAPNNSASGPTAASAPTSAASAGKSSNIGLYAGLGIGVLVLIGVIVFLITRGRNNNGSGGAGGGGGGGGNGYYPPTPTPGGHYAQPGQPQQYPTPPPNPYQQPSSGGQHPSQYPAQYPPQGTPYTPPSAPRGHPQQGQPPWPQQQP